MSESFLDQYSRVRQMANGDPTWDLSPNDIAALTAVMDYLDEHVGLISAQPQLLKSFHALLDYAESTVDKRRPTLAMHPKSGIEYVGMAPDDYGFIRDAKAAIGKAEGNT